MPEYKAVVTLTWKFESDTSHQECLDRAKAQLSEILDAQPEGADFDNFLVQVDVVQMKERKRLIHLGMFEIDEVFPYVTDVDCKKSYEVNGVSYSVRMNTDRYHVFKKNKKCVSCGLEGTKMVLDLNPGDFTPHFNLYSEEYGRLVLMTKDHKLAKSKGGSDELANYDTMCSICNNLKGAHDLTWEDCRELRRLSNNPNQLPRKELRDLINRTREEMAAKNAIEGNNDNFRGNSQSDYQQSASDESTSN